MLDKPEVLAGFTAQPRFPPWEFDKPVLFCFHFVLFILYFFLIFEMLCSFIVPPQQIRIGDFNHASEEDNKNAQNLEISKYFIHHLFKEKEAYFDIAILETAPIEKSDAVSPICLPSSQNNYDNNAAQLIGWGSKFATGSPSNKLQRVSLTVFPQRYGLWFLL